MYGQKKIWKKYFSNKIFLVLQKKSFWCSSSLTYTGHKVPAGRTGPRVWRPLLRVQLRWGHLLTVDSDLSSGRKWSCDSWMLRSGHRVLRTENIRFRDIILLRPSADQTTDAETTTNTYYDWNKVEQTSANSSDGEINF